MKKRAIWLSLVLTFTPVAFAQAEGESMAPGAGLNCAASAKNKVLEAQPTEKATKSVKSTGEAAE